MLDFLMRLMTWTFVMLTLFVVDSLLFSDTRYLFVAITGVWIGRGIFAKGDGKYA